MLSARAPPLIKTQPAPCKNAKGETQQYVVVYKDEGGKYNYDHTMRLIVPQTTTKISVAAYATCINAACAMSLSDVSGPPQFVSDKLFCVMECSRSGFKGPMSKTPFPVAAWGEKSNVWSFTSFMNTAVDIKCNFLKVSSKCICNTCGGETRFKIVVATNDNRVGTSLPISVKSKRKIPASMRKRSQRDIEAFIKKTRHKKTKHIQGGGTRASQKPATVRAQFIGKCVAPHSKKGFLTAKKAQVLYRVEEQSEHIAKLETNLAKLHAKLAKQEKLLAMYLERPKKRQKKKIVIAQEGMPGTLHGALDDFPFRAVGPEFSVVGEHIPQPLDPDIFSPEYVDDDFNSEISKLDIMEFFA